MLKLFSCENDYRLTPSETWLHTNDMLNNNWNFMMYWLITTFPLRVPAGIMLNSLSSWRTSFGRGAGVNPNLCLLYRILLLMFSLNEGVGSKLLFWRLCLTRSVTDEDICLVPSTASEIVCLNWCTFGTGWHLWSRVTLKTPSIWKIVAWHPSGFFFDFDLKLHLQKSPALHCPDLKPRT